ncbi:hypothetical protein [Nitratifractor sp.]|uniref:hypothetical protein n=1 Tax=Nitratifractor sp. TaxID=2268144 RepID=UPI0025FE5160|nr:hypothetical protein [Nitratifractor sp.]
MRRETSRLVLWGFLALGSALYARPTAPGEDSLIVQAVLNDESDNYAQGQRLYLKLYRRTGNVEYLVHAGDDAMRRGGDTTLIARKLKEWIRRHGRQSATRVPMRTLTLLYARSGRLQEAWKVARRWLVPGGEPQDLKLAATIAVDLKKYRQAVDLLQKAYTGTLDESYLLAEVTVLQKFLHEEKKAETLLENHLHLKPDSSVELYFTLISLYAREHKYGKVLALYKELYHRFPQQQLMDKIVKLSLYTGDLAGLIDFLEGTHGNEVLLYRLYKQLGRYDKAVALAKRRYRETHKPKWLAEEAILLYEEAKAEKKITPEVLQKFRALFDRALKEGADDSLYLNYYGYTLIDHGLDIDRGIALVRRALKQQPKNPYYLDSLAWGLYKKGECAQAKKVMEEVIAAGKIKEPEIAMHRKKIESCAEHGKK